MEGYQEVASMAVVVTLDVFSGRPNPHWPLTTAQVTELGQRLAQLRPAPSGPLREPPDLGYRGFQVDRSEDASLPGPLHVYRGIVTLPVGPPRADPGLVLERFLLETAGDRLEPAVRDYALHEIEGGV
jgi:hypothetical protein